jgi:hypothetical protein
MTLTEENLGTCIEVHEMYSHVCYLIYTHTNTRMYHTHTHTHDSEDTPRAEHFFASPNFAVYGIVLHNWLHKTSSSTRVLARRDRVRQANIFLQAQIFFFFSFISHHCSGFI